MQVNVRNYEILELLEQGVSHQNIADKFCMGLAAVRNVIYNWIPRSYITDCLCPYCRKKYKIKLYYQYTGRLKPMRRHCDICRVDLGISNERNINIV